MCWVGKVWVGGWVVGWLGGWVGGGWVGGWAGWGGGDRSARSLERGVKLVSLELSPSVSIPSLAPPPRKHTQAHAPHAHPKRTRAQREG